MKYAKTLLYTGEDAEFLDLLFNFFKSHDSEVNVQSKPYSNGSLVNTFTESPYHVLVIDFTCIEVTSEVFEEISYLKRVDSASGVLLCALFKDESHRVQFPHIYSMGFSLSFIKGCEAEVFLRNIAYISFSSKIAFPPFAKAKDLFTKLEVGLCSSITEMTEDSFKIDTDFETISGGIETGLPMYEELECKSFIVKEKFDAAEIYPMMNSYELEYPYASPWEEESSANLSKSTVETWIGLNLETSSLKPTEIFMLTTDMNIIKNLYNIENRRSFSINFFSVINENVCNSLPIKKPAIIFFEYNDQGDSNINELSSLVTLIKNIPEYFPFLVVTNNQSSSTGLQKALMYNLILGSKDQLTVEVFKVLTETFRRKRGEMKVNSNVFRFDINDSRRAIDVNLSIFISSITEHEITFFSKSHLPLFTVLHFLKPFEFYATILPVNEKLKSKEGYLHYKSAIHGLSENELMMLRQFVNQVIYDPAISFEKIVIDSKVTVVGPDVKEEEINIAQEIINVAEKKESISGLKEINGALKIRLK